MIALPIRIPTAGSRWRVLDNVSGGGKTLTVLRVVHPLLHRAYVEVWIGGELRRLPLDERWRDGLVQIGEEA